ncbi:MAG: hypothetical protein NC393_14910 [Clostridium sp.]|nr:hypothetical protein [Clostridium sp.]MCM1173399.1 hypothetical protein [Clostridium sp.]
MSNKQNYFNNILVYLILCIVFAYSLTGCGVQREIKINSSYSEWIDALGINDYSDTKCRRYHEYEHGITLDIMSFDYTTAPEFKKIIDNHNAFVKRNPDYFPEDFDIDFIFTCCGGDTQLQFSNYTGSVDYGKESNYIDLSSIETEKSHCMRYAYLSGLDDRIKTKFEAETIIISVGKYIDEVEEAQDWSENFEGFDKIVVRFVREPDEDEINIEEALEKIQRGNPGAELYYITYISYPDEYEIKKYTPEEN